MGLARSALRFIARVHRERPITGAVLTLGRQGVAASEAEARAILREEGLVAEAARPLQVQAARQLTGAGTRARGMISDADFFALLGITDLHALDVSTYEGADVVHDLNQPVPESWHGRYDLIIDGGTIEHVFDVRRSLTNIAAMLRPGGRVIHISPTNNYANHGFYQISPTLYFDYYSANGFANLHGVLAEQDIHRYDLRPWEIFELSAELGRLTSSGALMCLFVAERRPGSTCDVVPIQSFYRTLYQSQDPAARTLLGRIRQALPVRLKVLLITTLPFLDPFRRPWGLRRRGWL
jgi:SAM-dependent methyltransferase